MKVTRKLHKGELAMPDASAEIKILLENVAETKKLVFVVGAGISVSAGYPLWSMATKRALDRAQAKGLGSAAAGYAHEKYDKQQYYDVFEILQSELPEPTFYGIAEEVFSGGVHPAETHRLLATINCRGIITTNFDSCLEVACAQGGRGIPLHDFPQAMASDKFYVLKPHGSLETPRTMVLSKSDWKKVGNNRDFRELLAQCASSYQVVFMGYSMRDPDFNRIWDEILHERLFRSPAIYCCAKGALRHEQREEFRKRNVKVIEFPDDGTFTFISAALQALATHTTAVGELRQPSSNQPERVAKELEHYVLISLQFSETQQNRLILVTKALVLEALAISGAGVVELESVLLHVAKTLGQDSPVLREATKIAVQQLAEVDFVKIEDHTLTVNSDRIAALSQQALKLERSQGEWVERGLTQQAEAMQIDIETGDQANVTQVVEKVLLEVGKQVAELFLFNRPPRDESDKIDYTVDSFCTERGLAARKDLYKKTVKRMMFEPSDKDEDILFKKLQAYFISSAYVLDPTSEKLLSQYARDHWVYFDSSIILPALAVGHPSHPVYKRLLSRTQALGMRLRVIREMVNEVWANVRTALSALREFSKTGASMVDVLEGYVTMYGTGNGNVFLEGLLNRLRLDPSVTAESYLTEVLGTSDLHINEEQMIRAISDSLGIDCDSPEANEVKSSELEPIVVSIEHLRKQAGRFKTRRLCEHEARQFYLIHLRRNQNPQLSTKIWFVTTDRFLVELQRLERDKYPLPMSYTPRNWFQYLDLIDTESRGSKHFSRLQPKMRFGVVSGELGIDAIQTIIKEQRLLLEKGIVSVREMADAAVRDYHVRQSLADYDRKSGSTQDPAHLADAKNQIRNDIKKAVGQFIAVRIDEIDSIKGERDAAQKEAKSLAKKLAKEKHVARTLKAQQRTRKGKRR
jgi:NAD-dependent SIR2 family protein deacetylase